MIGFYTFRLPFIFFILITFFSCAKDGPVQFPAGIDIEDMLFASSGAAREGTLDFSKPKKLEYRFDDSFRVPPNSSFVIEYDFSVPVPQAVQENFSLVLDMGDLSWELPLDVYGVRYAVPMKESFNGKFSITLNGNDKIDKTHGPVFKIRSIRFTRRWFGFDTNTDEYFYSTPFVHRRDDKSYVIDVPESFMPKKQLVEIRAAFSSGNAALEFSGRRIEAMPGARTIYIPPPLYTSPGQAVLSSDEVFVFYLNTLREPPVFPVPVEADPALVIAWPKESWRESGYEVFRWERFPSLLIFDFADYDAQDRMLKRLAFFVEKAGFRGRLAPDEEIADLHGWNAHDYKADDLARFFNAARISNFPLSDEEWQLEKILLNEKIIREEADVKSGDIKSGGGIAAGTGGIISISRESADYLRWRFMAHEGYHGLFFIDEDFRNFSRRRWEQLPVTAKRFLTAFFEFQQYDIKDEYLLINEFMAHVLQQSVSQAGAYFGQNLPLRLESTWRAGSLPRKDEASGTWPSLASDFTDEAEAFSAYVNQRWGLAAGRVWNLRVN
jgi:hypothetical protein